MKREILAQGIGYTKITNKKFATNTVHVSFAVPICSEYAPLNALASSIIASVNEKLPTLSALTAKLSSLYGANLSVSVTKRGGIQIINFFVNTIVNKFTFDGEDVTSEAVEILLDCLFNPRLVNGVFEDEIFNFRKKDILDTIESEINNKRGYAIMRASNVIFDGEASAVSAYGAKEFALKATPQNTYDAYRNLLKIAAIEIFVVSPEDIDLRRRFKDGFAGLERNSSEIRYNVPSPLKANVTEKQEQLDVLQAKMVLGFKQTNTQISTYSAKLMSTILGETPSSKLFMNVREKLSLCYYCASGYQDSNKTLMVDCGVETENIAKTRAAILEQLAALKAGNISDDEINNAKLAIVNSLKTVGDKPTGLSHWYLQTLQQGDNLSPEETIEKYSPITKEDIIGAAKSFELDTVYVMLPNSAEN